MHTYNPMVAKTAYLLAAEAGTPAKTLSFGDGGSVALYSSTPGHVVLDFSAGAAKDGGAGTGKAVPFLQPFVYTAQGPAGVVDTFSALLDPAGAAMGDGPLADAVDEVAGSEPYRVVCTGSDPGGMELAVLCGPWAALHYPTANADVVTFGDAWSDAYNAQWAWAYQQLVTLHYQWPFAKPAAPARAPNGNLERAFAEALNPLVTQDAVAAAIAVPKMPDAVPKASAGWDPGSPIGEMGPAPGLAEEYKLPESDCPVIICKTREPLALSCLGFGKDEQYGEDVLAGLPHVTMKNNDTDGDAVVAWNATSRTLYVMFKYTEEQQDWLVDAQATQAEEFVTDIEPATSAPGGDRLNDVVPDVEVHKGFYKQFTSLAVEPVPGAASCIEGVPASQLVVAICQLGAQDPARVVVGGFSLGAGLSQLGGVWASQLFPAADVTVGNQGGPITGDNNFVTLAQATYGRTYRYVYRLDEVPSIPPLPDYHHTHSGVWIMEDDSGETEVLLQDRPNLEIWETTWNDHTCDVWQDPKTGEVIVGYVPRLFNATRVTVPAWVFTLA